MVDVVTRLQSTYSVPLGTPRSRINWLPFKPFNLCPVCTNRPFCLMGKRGQKAEAVYENFHFCVRQAAFFKHTPFITPHLLSTLRQRVLPPV